MKTHIVAGFVSLLAVRPMLLSAQPLRDNVPLRGCDGKHRKWRESVERDSYQQAFQRLLRDLKAEGKASA
jgi:hypothetical protein